MVSPAALMMLQSPPRSIKICRVLSLLKVVASCMAVKRKMLQASTSCKPLAIKSLTTLAWPDRMAYAVSLSRLC